MKKIVVGALVFWGLTASSAHAALIDRGGGMIYDDVLNITWLQDANYAFTSGYHNDGGMTWGEAMEWAENLVYGGFDDWRLPTVRPVGEDFDYDFSNNGTTDLGYGNKSPNSELAYMYYVNLGNLGSCTPNDAAPRTCVTQSGWGLRNRGPFENLGNPIGRVYWSGTEQTPTVFAWFFAYFDGIQFVGYNLNEGYAWAVRPGDVTSSVPAPEPGTFALLGLGLAGLGLSRRRLAA